MKLKLLKMSLYAVMALLLNGSLSYADEGQPPVQGMQQGMKKPPKRPKFSELDLNGDGSLTLEEFKQHKRPHPTPEEIFTHIDANGDGQISEEEFKDHRPPPPPGH